jgi:tetratricopeptide (TPR) repeat protein
MDHYLRVFLEESQLPLGHVMDIHTKGMRLITENAITTEKELSISMELPANGGKRERVHLKACKIWSNANPELGISETGFHITGPREALPIIENLIADLKKRAVRLAEGKIPQLEAALRRYKNALDTLATSSTPALISEVLKTRDAVQDAFSNKDSHAGNTLTTIVKLDGDLKKQARLIARQANLSQLRASFNPPSEAWWWFLDQRQGWLWDVLPTIFVILTFFFLVDILPRTFQGGADFYRLLPLSLGLAAPLFVAKGRIARAWPKWNKVRLFISAFFCLVAAGTYFTKPEIADFFRDRGFHHYKANQFATAESLYQRALGFDPNDAETHFYLGLLYEDLHDLKASRNEYQIAAYACKDDDTCFKSYNNLARLYIVDQNHAAAVTLLKRKLEPKEEIKHLPEPVNNARLRYYLLKNLGWARFEQGHLEEAMAKLQEASDIAENSPAIIQNDERASVYCLFAQVFEKLLAKKGMPLSKANSYWQMCLSANEGETPEEDAWYFKAQERLSQMDNLPPQGENQ